MPGSTSSQALQDTPTTPSAEPPVSPGQSARFYVFTGPAGHTNHPLGRTRRPPRPMCPVLPPHRPCRTLSPLPGLDFLSLKADVPVSTSSHALQNTPTNPWAQVPIPRGHFARFYPPTGPAGRSDHCQLHTTPRQ